MQLDPKKILDAKGGTGIGVALPVEAYEHIIIAFHTVSSTNATTKVQGSIQKDRPTFGSAQSLSNSWEYMQIKDLEDASAIDGNTGIVQTGTDFNRYYEVNVNGLRWLNLNVTARSAGAITAWATGFNHNHV